MAQIPQQQSGTGLQIETLAPPGQHVGVCVMINDTFGVERPSFDDKNVKERVDVTRFVFGLFGQDGNPYLVQTYEYKISGAPNSNLMKFLKAWTGQTPSIGWDYCELTGFPVALTVEHRESTKQKGVFYANIAGVGPVHPQLQNLVPPVHLFSDMLAKLQDPANRKPSSSTPVASPLVQKPAQAPNTPSWNRPSPGATANGLPASRPSAFVPPVNPNVQGGPATSNPRFPIQNTTPPNPPNAVPGDDDVPF